MAILCGYRGTDNEITACRWAKACWKWLQLRSYGFSCLLCCNRFHCLWLFCVFAWRNKPADPISFSWDMHGMKLQLCVQNDSDLFLFLTHPSSSQVHTLKNSTQLTHLPVSAPLFWHALHWSKTVSIHCRLAAKSPCLRRNDETKQNNLSFLLLLQT